VKLDLVRVLDDDGQVIDPGRAPQISADDLRRIHEEMLRVRLLDERLLKLQRQGRIGFYLTATGEEATHIGAAYALRPKDWIYPCYREIGAALYRGYPLGTLVHQLFGNAEDPIKGRQMPIHHSIKRLNYVSISSPVGTQIPQATGIAMAAKRMGRDDVSLVYFGDGATSTGAFHVALNQAAVDKAPCIFLCRNNGWAISTPREAQTATPTIAQKAIAYGIPGIWCDGNDVLALISVIREAAARARKGLGPTLIEARTYRRGAHSSSDDPSAYREAAEPEAWVAHDPIARFRAFLMHRGLWSDDAELDFKNAFDQALDAALADVERVAPKPPVNTMFEDVLPKQPWHLREQQESLQAEIARHGQHGNH